MLSHYGSTLLAVACRLQGRTKESEARTREEKNYTSPLHRLPNEILAIIFEYAILDRPESHVRLGSLCRRWQTIVQDTPSLWSTIHVDLTGLTTARAHRPLDQFPLRVSKSGNTALDLKVIFGDRRTATADVVHSTLSPHLVRCRKLQLQAGGDAQPLVFSLPEMMPLLEELTLLATAVIIKIDLRKRIQREGQLPPLQDFPPIYHSLGLRSLHLQGPFAVPLSPMPSPNLATLILRHHVIVDMAHFVAIFQGFPFLETLTLHIANAQPPSSTENESSSRASSPEPASASVSHSHLKSLIIESFEAISWLTALTSPSLERIEYRLSSIRDGVRVIGMQPHKTFAKYAKLAFPNMTKWNMTASTDPNAGFLADAGVSRGGGVLGTSFGLQDSGGL